MTTNVSIKTNPPSIAAVHRRMTSHTAVFENIPAGLAAVFGVLDAAGVEPVGPPTTVFHQVPDGDIDGEIAVRVPIAHDIEAVDGVATVTIPEQTVATIVHEGSYGSLGETHATIARWIQEQGHEIAGPSTETYLNSPGDVAEADLRTEVAVPVSANGCSEK